MSRKHYYKLPQFYVLPRVSLSLPLQLNTILLFLSSTAHPLHLFTLSLTDSWESPVLSDGWQSDRRKRRAIRRWEGPRRRAVKVKQVEGQESSPCFQTVCQFLFIYFFYAKSKIWVWGGGGSPPFSFHRATKQIQQKNGKTETFEHWLDLSN